MKIKEITFYNYRVYKGLNTIDLSVRDGKNIIIVSGNNGYGKTSFLTGLVWCLYGKQMEMVDEMYKKEVDSQGGYQNFFHKSLNRDAKKEGISKYYVEVLMEDVELVDGIYNVRIKREYDIQESTDTLYIKSESEDMPLPDEEYLDEDKNKDYFIRENILPIDIAKFFLFDAEKIVNIAELSLTQQGEELSKAYSQILGIHKYEQISDYLEQLLGKIKRESASPDEVAKFNNLRTQYDTLIEITIPEIKTCIEELKEKKRNLDYQKQEIENSLIEKALGYSEDYINNLRKEEEELKQEESKLKQELLQLYEWTPLASAGNLLLLVKEKIDTELQEKWQEAAEKDIDEKINTIIDKFWEEYKKNTSDEFSLHRRLKNIIEQAIEQAVRETIYELPIENKPTSGTFKLNYTENQKNQIEKLINYIATSFKEVFAKTIEERNMVENRLLEIRNKIKKAEASVNTEETQQLRERKKQKENEIENLLKEIGAKEQELKELENKANKISYDIKKLEEKVKTREEFKKKEKFIKDLRSKLNDFINKFHKKKKETLEQRILAGLKSIMHKTNLIDRVEIQTIERSMSIRLYNSHGEEIPKNSLSKGEQQMLATAILKGLVEESGIEFPVFIDSPMQKFDQLHATNIIEHFYPTISEQVVIFPLLNKELTEKEYQKLIPYIAKSYLIINEDGKSSFEEIAPEELLNTYNKKYLAYDK
ncbi:DNA sulfur modification protein DndD [Thermonema lapsum]|uniref:DNA sulfur modification protein DndD n=1 Tax=Thermonema lapsum TaxID=28195 RepID=A0A846MPG5_9BACT|nr:DNA sulfur modification protein DndD [Thermonema lapsum]NIK73292.1 DNA sulfur modification protein DndD [Thermonema lapsum]